MPRLGNENGTRVLCLEHTADRSGHQSNSVYRLESIVHAAQPISLLVGAYALPLSSTSLQDQIAKVAKPTKGLLGCRAALCYIIVLQSAAHFCMS